MGRKPNQQPATFYDYRRVILLVQTLDTGNLEHIRAMCERYNIVCETYRTGYPPYYFISIATLQELAHRVLQHARQETESKS